MARGEAPGRWRGTECSRRQQTTETGELTGMQHAVTMHDEAGEAAEGRTLRCCRSTRAQTPPEKPVEQWWLPSILSRQAQAPFQWCNHFPETRSNPTPSGSHHTSLLRRMRAHTCDTAAFTGETYFQKLRKKCRHARSLGIAMGGPSLAQRGKSNSRKWWNHAVTAVSAKATPEWCNHKVMPRTV